MALPGLQVTCSHLDLLEEDGVVYREERAGMFYFALEQGC